MSDSTDPRLIALRDFMADKGLKASRQRELIIEVFFAADGHLSVDELFATARHRDSKISQATVYRTMRLLTDSGVAQTRRFGDGHTRYELSDTGAHHDHLICRSCRTIIEFMEPQIEALQEAVAEQHGFQLESHKMELYGLCRDCRSS